MIVPKLSPVDAADLSTWENVAPRFEALQAQPLSDATVASWLTDWSELSEQVGEAAALLSIAYTQDTEDADRKAAYLHYVKEIAPQLRVADQALKDRLLATGWESPAMAVALRQLRADAALYRAENVPLLAEEQASAARYSEVTGGLTVDFDGARRTLSQLAPYRASAERAVREGAWRAGMSGLLGVRETLDDLFDELLGLRVQNCPQRRLRQLPRLSLATAGPLRLHPRRRVAAAGGGVGDLRAGAGPGRRATAAGAGAGEPAPVGPGGGRLRRPAAQALRDG